MICRVDRVIDSLLSILFCISFFGALLFSSLSFLMRNKNQSLMSILVMFHVIIRSSALDVAGAFVIVVIVVIVGQLWRASSSQVFSRNSTRLHFSGSEILTARPESRLVWMEEGGEEEEGRGWEKSRR